MENRWDDCVKLTFWAINRLEAMFEHFTGGGKIVKKATGDTTCSSKSVVSRTKSAGRR